MDHTPPKEQIATYRSAKLYNRNGCTPCLRVSNRAATAEISLHGGQVLTFTPHGQLPLLWLSDQAIFETGKAIRGGIPVCWPWFGNHPETPELPAHGFVRTRPWQLLEISEPSEYKTKITLELTDSPETQTLWPNAFRIRLLITVAKELNVELETENTDDHPWTCGGALHSYFSVGDICETRISTVAGLDYLDKPSGFTRKQQTEALTFAAEVDRVYLQHRDKVFIEDLANQRNIQVEKSGSTITVIWNPWSDIARRMQDMNDEDYRRFVCVEPANAFDDLVTLKPGEVHRLSTCISRLD